MALFFDASHAHRCKPARALRPRPGLALGLALGLVLANASLAAPSLAESPAAAASSTPAATEVSPGAARRARLTPSLPEETSLTDRVLDTVANKAPRAVMDTATGAFTTVYDSTLGWLLTNPNGDGVAYSLQAPHYGDALFNFFQDRYFSAITGLMVSQHFERVAPHSDEGEVLRGGMLLSYGMPRQAGEIFAGLIERGAAPPVRDRAWFYLAKIRYQRGYLEEAEEALAHVGDRLPAALQEERGLLQASLLMARADYIGAAAALAAMPVKTLGARYARYNLGVALVRSGDPAGGSAVLDALGKEGAPDEEYRSLRDQANVALGYAALADHRPEAARAVLERVRLKSLHANKALLGFGWAATEMKDAKLALVPWLELADRGVSDSAALEARIAVPYAYAELGAYGQAMDRYQEAVTAFDKENGDLKESIAAIRAGKLVDALIVHNPGEEMGWFWSLQDVPDMPHAAHLAPVLAEHAFQEAFKNYRDLLFLNRNLIDWNDKLGVFDDMLETRRKAFAERLPAVRAGAAALDVAALGKRRDALDAEIAAGEAAGDGIAFADKGETELLGRIEAVEKALAGAPAGDADAASARDRLRLASGVLLWQLAQQQTDRAWDAAKEMRRIDAEIAGAERRSAELAQAQRDEPARFDRFAERIAALRPRLARLIPQVTRLAREQQNAVQAIAVAALERQQDRLAVYSTQARFSIAQLYDRAYVKKEASHVSARP